MKNIKYLLFASVAIMASCSGSDDDTPSDDTFDTIETPASYVFTNDAGESTVSFTGQTARIAMAEELFDALGDVSGTVKTADELINMLAHEAGNDDFTDTSLNPLSNQIWSKLAESVDYFKDETGALTADSDVVRTYIEDVITEQANDVLTSFSNAASEGVAGQLVSTSRTVYVNGDGVELDQVFAKSLIGALMADQIINDYLTLSQTADNETIDTEAGETYTTMEHYWDEAYGYLYGAEADTENPVLGADSFLNKYLNSVDGDDDFTGIAEDILNAFKLGRAAIVAEEYDIRDEQIEIIREKISQVIGVRAVYYLAAGQEALNADEVDFPSAFHSISEGLGFVYSLQFTRKANVDTPTPYFTGTEVQGFLDQILDVEGGLWNENTATTLGELAEEIAAEFTFTVEEAAN